MKYDTTDFQKDVIEESKKIPVLVDFWAEWCGPCRILGPVLEKLADTNNGRWKLVKVNTEALPDIAQRYNVRSIPNVQLFVNGEAVNEFVGALPQRMVEQWLKKALPGKFEKELARARELIEKGQMTEAAGILEPIATEEPDNHDARTLLSKIIFPTDPERAVKLIDGIEEDSEFFDTAAAFRTLAELLIKLQHPDKLPDALIKDVYISAIEELKAGNYDGALEKFIYAIRNERFYDDDGARKACIAIFKYLGEEHPISLKHRRDFGSALFI
jgi:putative thioredoxin